MQGLFSFIQCRKSPGGGAKRVFIGRQLYRIANAQFPLQFIKGFPRRVRNEFGYIGMNSNRHSHLTPVLRPAKGIVDFGLRN